LTHSHWDHVLGRPWWPNAQTIAHDRFAAHVAANAAEIRAEAERYASEAHERWPAPFQPFRPDVAASGLHYTTIGPWRVVFRDAPGHDDAQLSLHLPERRVLIAADMLSDVEVPMLDRPPSAYVRTLEALLPIADGGAIETLIPGHGSIAEGRDAVLERFRRDLDYLRRLVREVAALRSRGVTRERALEQSAPWEDVERHPDYAMREVHRENLGHAWDERRAKR
jgi:glyoxylase-like metal-dependent hydrolase (beta-lactamase superfamily II)